MTDKEKMVKWMRGETFDPYTLSEKSEEYWKKMAEKDAQPRKVTLEGFKESAVPREIFRVNYRMTVQEMAGYFGAAYASEVAGRGGEVQNDTNLQYLTAKCCRFLTGGGKSSLVLTGGCGCGKSTALRAIASVIRYLGGVRLRLITANALFSQLRSGEKDAQRAQLLMVDDLGIEPVTFKDYGNDVTPIVDAIYYRYDHRLPMVISTNKTLEEIADIYGERVADRLKEMAEIIQISQKSYRK